MAAAGDVVLVVEDEPVTRQAAVGVVEEAGYRALEAANGIEALKLLEDVAEIRVVITDIDMPLGLDGIRLAACIHHRWRDIGVIVTSGKVRPKPGDVPGEGRFFAKPYREDEVVAVIRDIIEL